MQRTPLRSLLTISIAGLIAAGCSRTGAASTWPQEASVNPEVVERSSAEGEGLDDAPFELPEIHAPVVEPTPRDAFVLAVQEERWDDAGEPLTHWRVDENDVEGMTALIVYGIHLGNYADARAQARALEQRNPDQREHWQQLYYDAFMADPDLWQAEARELVYGVDFDSLEALGGGSTVTIKVKQGGETIAVFKPHSTLGQSYYRGEIAAYRLCELIDCGYIIPRNIEIKIRLEDFLQAYGLRALDRASPGTYARRFRDLIVFTDDTGQKWLHGTLKDWAPGFTTYPVEHVDGWQSFVNGSRTRAQLDALSLEDALRPMRGKERSYVAGMLERGGDTTGIDFIRQLSNLHLMDALLNNWDRYSGEFYGVNCQWNHGHFVSIDNGATLQPPGWGSNQTTRNRQRRIRIYSRSTVEALRHMDMEQVRTILLPPNPYHTDSDVRFERFVQARLEFLAWIDDQIARRGEANVLILD